MPEQAGTCTARAGLDAEEIVKEGSDNLGVENFAFFRLDDE